MAIFFAAITSAIAQLEIPIATFMHGFGWTRAKATAIIVIITLICVIVFLFGGTVVVMLKAMNQKNFGDFDDEEPEAVEAADAIETNDK